MKLSVLFSGGKDSTLAACLAEKEGHEILSLATMHSSSEESYMFHYPNTWLTKLQAAAMHKRLLTSETKGIKEKELKDLENLLKIAKKDGAQGIAAGALASQYQYERVKRICKKLKLKVYTPLWHIEPEDEWKMLFKYNFRVVITGVSAEGLTKEWLGKEIDENNFGKLKELSRKYDFHLSGEGGEYETLVIDCPFFRHRIEIGEREVIWNSQSEAGWLKVKSARLADK
ncbi:MAG: diphthine--ammonia ligase [Candidatus Aenigmarchaeota archaeon]|nr:diphthine--ammonia ligase [Candidatus Aenigmarchaeota archaeon]